jgi:threonine dehydrogenase-like Zn-dependent dehydrogenase
VITHRLRLDDAAKGYKVFRDKRDNCITGGADRTHRP